MAFSGDFGNNSPSGLLFPNHPPNHVITSTNMLFTYCREINLHQGTKGYRHCCYFLYHLKNTVLKLFFIIVDLQNFFNATRSSAGMLKFIASVLCVGYALLWYVNQHKQHISLLHYDQHRDS